MFYIGNVYIWVEPIILQPHAKLINPRLTEKIWALCDGVESMENKLS